MCRWETTPTTARARVLRCRWPRSTSNRQRPAARVDSTPGPVRVGSLFQRRSATVVDNFQRRSCGADGSRTVHRSAQRPGNSFERSRVLGSSADRRGWSDRYAGWRSGKRSNRHGSELVPPPPVTTARTRSDRPCSHQAACEGYDSGGPDSSARRRAASRALRSCAMRLPRHRR
jgi:hypothetical protein